MARELFSNIAKYADAHFAYVLTIEVSCDEYAVRLRNAIAAKPSAVLDGTGLSRFRNQLVEHGGELLAGVQEENEMCWWVTERIFPEKPMYKALHFGFREIPGSASAFKPIPQSETI
mgnify:FL=1